MREKMINDSKNNETAVPSVPTTNGENKTTENATMELEDFKNITVEGS